MEKDLYSEGWVVWSTETDPLLSSELVQIFLEEITSVLLSLIHI